MPVNYTNRKGQTYTLYRGQTRSGKPRYYFGYPGQDKDEPVTELPPGYTISESVNCVVSLVKNKDLPSPIRPEEVARVVRFLCVDAPFAMTGSAVEVFG